MHNTSSFDTTLSHPIPSHHIPSYPIPYVPLYVKQIKLLIVKATLVYRDKLRALTKWLHCLNRRLGSCCVKTPKIGSNAPDFVCFSVKIS